MQVAPAEESNKVSKLSLSSYGCKTRDVYQEGKSSGVKRGVTGLKLCWVELGGPMILASGS
jgi:hypothetical protein